MAIVSLVNPTVHGRLLPFRTTDPAGDTIPWDGTDLHLEFRNTHSSAITVTISPVDLRAWKQNVGFLNVPTRTYSIPAGQDASFFFDSQDASAYVNNTVMLQVAYTGGNVALLVRAVSFGTAAEGFQTGEAQSVFPSLAASVTVVYQPTMKISQTLFPNFIAVTGNVRNPAVDFQRILAPNFFGPTSSVFNPTLIRASFVMPDFVGVTGNVRNPAISVGNVNVAPSFLAVTGSVYQPTVLRGNVNVTPNHIAAATTLFGPTVFSGQFVAPNFLAASGVVYQPTVVRGNVNVAPTFIAASGVIYSPTVVRGNVNVTPNLISATSVFGPTVLRGGVFAFPDFLAGASVVYSPTAVPGNINIAPTFIAAASVIYQPSISVGGVSLTPNLLGPTSSVFNPVVLGNTIVTPTFIASVSTVSDPAISVGGVFVTPNFVAATSVVFNPVVVGLQTITPNFVAATGGIFDPTVLRGGVSVVPNFLGAGSTVYNPTIVVGNKNVAVNFLAAATSVFNPTVVRGGVSVTPNFLAASGVIYSPTVVRGNVNVTPNLIAVTGSVYNPTVVRGNVNVTPNFLSAGGSVYNPTVEALNPPIEKLFAMAKYTGNVTARSIVNGIDLAGKGGLVWIRRENSTGQHFIFDTERGALSEMNTEDALVPATLANSLTSFNSDGFSLGTQTLTNVNNGEMMSWAWAQGYRFFDMVPFTGNGAARTIAHNLGGTPGMIIVRKISAGGNWNVWHRSLANTEHLVLSSTGAKTTGDTTIWNSTDPTSSVFSVGASVQSNNNGDSYVAYLFAHDTTTPGLIQCGTFTTDGSGDATVSLGWEPQYLMVKPVTSGAWAVVDTEREWSLNTGLTDRVIAPASTASPNNDQVGHPKADGFVIDAYTASTTFVYMAIRRGLMTQPTDATSVFDVLGHTGIATITPTVDYTADLVITKQRAAVRAWNWQTKLQGYTLQLDSSSTAAETTATDAVLDMRYNEISFDKNNVTGATSQTYVDLVLKRAPGFYDAVAFAGTGAAHTETHKLGVAPELMIVKCRSAANDWAVYYGTNTNYVLLNSTAATAASSAYWNNTSPTSSVFTVGTDADVNTNGALYIAHLFASCPGVSKVGTYTGTAAALQVNCGFTAGARLVLIKRLDSTGDWYVFDTFRGIVSGSDPYLLMNSTAAEASSDYIDPYSAGFEVAAAAPAGMNASGGTYLYLAIA